METPEIHLGTLLVGIHLKTNIPSRLTQGGLVKDAQDNRNHMKTLVWASSPRGHSI